MSKPKHPCPYYELNCGQYVLHDTNGRPVKAPLDEIALVFDRECGVLHKHGSVQMVSDWMETVRKKTESVRGMDGLDLYGDLVMLSGRFPVKELNRCLDTTGYVLKLHKAFIEGTLQQEPWGYGPTL